MKKLLLSIVLSTITLSIFAQQPDIVAQTFVADTNFFVVILLGVLLAFGFQVLMTTISVAIGVVSIGNLKEAYVESKYERNDDDDDEDDDDRFEIGSSGTNTGVLITSGLGLWNVVTMTVSLFAATLLALQLNPVSSLAVQVTLGLSIWAAFFMLMFYFESKFIGSLAGTLVGAVVGGLKSSADAIKSMFTPSQATQAQSMIDNTVEKVRAEFSDVFDGNEVNINETVNNFLNRAEKRMPSYEQLKADISQIVSENMPERSSDNNNNNNNSSNRNRTLSAAKWTAIQTAIQTVIENSDTLREGGKRGQQKVKQLQALVADLQNTYKNADTRSAGISKVAAQMSALEEADAKNYIEQIKSSIQAAKPEDFNNKKLQTRLNDILSTANEKAGAAVATLKSLDEETVINTLVQNTSLSKKDVNQYASQVQHVLQTIKNQLPTNSKGDIGIDKNEVNRLKKAIESKVANFIDSTDNDELDYGLLKYDFKRAMNNPSHSMDIIKQRLSTFDRDTIISVLTNNDKINRSDINKIADQIDAAKNEVNYQIQKVEDKTRATMKNLERKAVIQAEAARKTMISAASWLLISMIVSGAAAVAASFIVA